MVFFHLVLGHVDQQVRNVKDGIIFVHADIDLELLAFLRIDDAAQGQGNAGPLILLDAAVVMGTEVDKASCSWTGLPLRSRRGASIWEPTIFSSLTGSLPITARMTDLPFWFQ